MGSWVHGTDILGGGDKLTYKYMVLDPGKCAGDGTYFGLDGRWDLLNLTTILKNWCFPTVVLKKTLESPLDSKEIKPVNPKWNQPWIFIGRTDAEVQYSGHWMQRTNYWKRPWCWERLRAGGEGDDRGWDGWMASLTQWTWVWENSRRQWRTRKPGVLQSMGSQRVWHSLATEQQQDLLRRWHLSWDLSEKKGKSHKKT